MNEIDEKKLESLRAKPSLVSLFELRKLGEFARWQDLELKLTEKLVEGEEFLSYPLFYTRSKPNFYVDIFLDSKWKTVEFIKADKEYIYFRYNDKEGEIPFNIFNISPKGIFTSYNNFNVNVKTAKLSKYYNTQTDYYTIHSSELDSFTFPYVTVKINYYPTNARWVDYFYERKETFHISDPRVEIEGVKSIYPHYNCPIAVSHRWLHNSAPDPKNLQFLEFIKICDQYQLTDYQTFFIDYSSLPQNPRTNEEECLFQERLENLMSYFEKSAIILTTGAEDYFERAWCMLELMISSLKESIINEKGLEGNISLATNLVKRYKDSLKYHSQNINESNLLNNLSTQNIEKWISNPIYLGLYNQKENDKARIIKKFRSEMKVTDEMDREKILNILEKIYFRNDLL